MYHLDGSKMQVGCEMRTLMRKIKFLEVVLVFSRISARLLMMVQAVIVVASKIISGKRQASKKAGLCLFWSQPLTLLFRTM